MSMSRFRWVLVPLAVGLALIAATQVGARTDRTAAKPPIKIGISLPLTGNFSEPGTAAMRGYKIWQQLVNNRGGLLGRKVQLLIRDDASNQNTIVADYTRLITEDKVDLLLGTFSSLLNLPASAVAERFKMVYVEPAGGSPRMFNRGFQYLFFAQQATAPHQGDLFSAWAWCARCARWATRRRCCTRPRRPRSATSTPRQSARRPRTESSTP